jgi:predicted enzyme related to lactoylglutathione lyase
MGRPVVHFEIVSKGAPQLRDFYRKTFGWEIGEPAPGPMDYTVVQTGDGLSGGIGETPEDSHGHVTFYVGITDMNRAFADVVARGGKKLRGPDHLPGGYVIGFFADPGGHEIGLIEIPE